MRALTGGDAIPFSEVRERRTCEKCGATQDRLVRRG